MERTAQDDLQGLIFATANVRYLRGLSMLPMGLLLITFPVMGQLAKTQPLIVLTGLLAGITAVVFLTRRINRYYDDQYGRVKPAH